MLCQNQNVRRELCTWITHTHTFTNTQTNIAHLFKNDSKVGCFLTMCQALCSSSSALPKRKTHLIRPVDIISDVFTVVWGQHFDFSVTDKQLEGLCCVRKGLCKDTLPTQLPSYITAVQHCELPELNDSTLQSVCYYVT